MSSRYSTIFCTIAVVRDLSLFYMLIALRPDILLACVKTMGGWMITLIFTTRFLWRLLEIDRTCSLHCCAFQIMSFQTFKKIPQETESNKIMKEKNHVGLCRLALIQGRGHSLAEVSVQPLVSL